MFFILSVNGECTENSKPYRPETLCFYEAQFGPIECYEGSFHCLSNTQINRFVDDTLSAQTKEKLYTSMLKTVHTWVDINNVNTLQACAELLTSQDEEVLLAKLPHLIDPRVDRNVLLVLLYQKSLTPSQMRELAGILSLKGLKGLLFLIKPNWQAILKHVQIQSPSSTVNQALYDFLKRVCVKECYRRISLWDRALGCIFGK